MMLVPHDAVLQTRTRVDISSTAPTSLVIIEVGSYDWFPKLLKTRISVGFYACQFRLFAYKVKCGDVESESRMMYARLWAVGSTVTFRAMPSPAWSLSAP